MPARFAQILCRRIYRVEKGTVSLFSFLPGTEEGTMKPDCRNGTPTIIHIPPSELLFPETDLRESRDPEHIANLAAAMQREGFTGTILARRVAGGVQAIWGWTRCLAALQARLPSVPVQLMERELTSSDILMLQLDEQELRVDFKPLEVAKGYQELMRLNGWTQGELARRRRKSASHVAKVLAISKNACPEVQALVAAGLLPPRAAYHISRLSDIPTQIDLAKKVKEGSLCVEAAEEHVARLLGNGKAKKPKPAKGRTPGGVAYMLPSHDLEAAHAEVLLLAKAIKKAMDLGLPGSSVQSLLKSR